MNEAMRGAINQAKLQLMQIEGVQAVGESNDPKGFFLKVYFDSIESLAKADLQTEYHGLKLVAQVAGSITRQ